MISYNPAVPGFKYIPIETILCFLLTLIIILCIANYMWITYKSQYLYFSGHGKYQNYDIETSTDDFFYSLGIIPPSVIQTFMQESISAEPEASLHDNAAVHVI